MTKAFEIPKDQAYKLFKSNASSAGIDQLLLKDFEENQKVTFTKFGIDYYQVVIFHHQSW
ncbi:hypothetical protein [Francisella frigiditurris]|uniref:Putative reverse transcriptase/retron type n=1 Tax=Francisella frigiditurris TaxID=1542390 RepID=A0A1J0KRE8_9GAMM|nr:hypothetical protein [Francisella frigiditurris]APC96336.1 putative reverse transcriptase/retron type [Francisella frigiditurris]